MYIYEEQLKLKPNVENIKDIISAERKLLLCRLSSRLRSALKSY